MAEWPNCRVAWSDCQPAGSPSGRIAEWPALSHCHRTFNTDTKSSEDISKEWQSFDHAKKMEWAEFHCTHTCKCSHSKRKRLLASDSTTSDGTDRSPLVDPMSSLLSAADENANTKTEPSPPFPAPEMCANDLQSDLLQRQVSVWWKDGGNRQWWSAAVVSVCTQSEAPHTHVRGAVRPRCAATKVCCHQGALPPRSAATKARCH